MKNFGNKLLFWANRQLTVVKKKCSMQGFCDLLSCGRGNNNNRGRHYSFQTNSDMTKYFLRGSRGFSTTYRRYDNRYVIFPLISISGGTCKTVFGDCYLRVLLRSSGCLSSIGWYWYCLSEIKSFASCIVLLSITDMTASNSTPLSVIERGLVSHYKWTP